MSSAPQLSTPELSSAELSSADLSADELSAADLSPPQLIATAEAFHGPGSIQAVSPLGNGNVNDTFLVESSAGLSVLQRINTRVFHRPEQVVSNLAVLERHVQAKLCGESGSHPLLQGRRWEFPGLVGPLHRCDAGHAWRCINYVHDTVCVDVVSGPEQARELGIGLGLFHHLISDLPVEQLDDTLEGFHITPLYLEAYRRALVQSSVQPSAATDHCMAFIRDRETLSSVLELAKAKGEVPLRPIHGDPKINNVMLDRHTGEAVALIDLDTVKPGLVHYDIGDCLRSCCNPLGEETTDLEAVRFDLDLAEAILEGYFSVAADFLTPGEVRLIPDAARLISFELGLRFFSDYLSGSTYFKASHPQHNLQRALVQFQLTASIEAQMDALRELVDELAQGANAALQRH